MSGSIPYGARENERLEFKGGEALAKPEIVGRAVVAMLNASGGTIWVGVREEQGRAAAVESIAAPDLQQRRLLDYMMDAIEPAPSGGELWIEQEHGDAESIVLRITVRPDRRKQPFALVGRGGGRLFVMRVGDRVRPMTREEIFRHGSVVEDTLDTALETTARKVLEERNSVQRKDGHRLWIRLQPTAAIDLDVQDERFEELLLDPGASGNRAAGWSFARRTHDLAVRNGRLVTDPADRAQVEIRRDGGLVFAIALEQLYWKGDPQEIWPLMLLEYPVSAFRIARRVYDGKLEPLDRVVADLALFGLKGWKLRPGSPGPWFRDHDPEPFSESDDLTLEPPLVFKADEIASEPDRCGVRLVERVYEAFGHRREAIPSEFDRRAGRLVLPE